MTRRPKKPNKPKKPAARKANAPSLSARKRKSAAVSAKPARPDPLDDMIAAGARTLDLTVERAWLPAVRTNLQVTLRLGSIVAAFALPDDADPAPIFKA